MQQDEQLAHVHARLGQKFDLRELAIMLLLLAWAQPRPEISGHCKMPGFAVQPGARAAWRGARP
ncbi:hypothetical protein WJ968_07525 [Achromobacter xylosoxidans]